MGNVIKGWDEGCLTMNLGEEAALTCTPDYAYGAGGFPAWGIPPNATLVFTIEIGTPLLSVCAVPPHSLSPRHSQDRLKEL